MLFIYLLRSRSLGSCLSKVRAHVLLKVEVCKLVVLLKAEKLGKLSIS